jgi:segregation and condensation protein A
LPLLEFGEEEEEEIRDLAKQLEEYKKFKEAALLLGKMSELGKISYVRPSFANVKNIFYPPENMDIGDFKKYFQMVLHEIPIVEKLEEEIVREVITLEEKINDLQNTMRERVEMSFHELTHDAADKIDVILSFLAMLEMVKQRIIDVEQHELFQEIRLRNKTAN